MSGKTLNYRRPDNRRDQKEQPKEANVLSMTVTLKNKQEHPKLTFRGVFAAR